MMIHFFFLFLFFFSFFFFYISVLCFSQWSFSEWLEFKDTKKINEAKPLLEILHEDMKQDVLKLTLSSYKPCYSGNIFLFRYDLLHCSPRRMDYPRRAFFMTIQPNSRIERIDTDHQFYPFTPMGLLTSFDLSSDTLLQELAALESLYDTNYLSHFNLPKKDYLKYRKQLDILRERDALAKRYARSVT
jgi:hypothetical protein